MTLGDDELPKLFAVPEEEEGSQISTTSSGRSVFGARLTRINQDAARALVDVSDPKARAAGPAPRIGRPTTTGAEKSTEHREAPSVAPASGCRPCSGVAVRDPLTKGRGSVR